MLTGLPSSTSMLEGSLKGLLSRKPRAFVGIAAITTELLFGAEATAEGAEIAVETEGASVDAGFGGVLPVTMLLMTRIVVTSPTAAVAPATHTTRDHFFWGAGGV